MAKWRVRGYQLFQWKGDHGQHVHVYKDRAFIGRYDYEKHEWLEGPYRDAPGARRAIRDWLEIQGL